MSNLQICPQLCHVCANGGKSSELYLISLRTSGNNTEEIQQISPTQPNL